MALNLKGIFGNNPEEQKKAAEYEEYEEENEYEGEEEEEDDTDDGKALEVRVVRPKKYDEAPEIANYLLNGKLVFLNLESTDKVNSTRILDYLMGAIYILKGDLQPVSSTAFMIGPSGVDITGAIPTEAASKPENKGQTSGGFGNL